MSRFVAITAKGPIYIIYRQVRTLPTRGLMATRRTKRIVENASCQVEAVLRPKPRLGSI